MKIGSTCVALKLALGYKGAILLPSLDNTGRTRPMLSVPQLRCAAVAESYRVGQRGAMMQPIHPSSHVST